MYRVVLDTGNVTGTEIFEAWNMVKDRLSQHFRPSHDITTLGGAGRPIGVITEEGEQYFGVMHQDLEEGKEISIKGDEFIVSIKKVV